MVLYRERERDMQKEMGREIDRQNRDRESERVMEEGEGDTTHGQV